MNPGPTAGWQTVEIRWSGVTLDGAPATGSLFVTANLPGGATYVIDATGADAVKVYPVTIRVPIVDGRARALLPASDDPDITPTGWTYTIREQITRGTGARSVTMPIPLAAAAAGIDLNDHLTP